MNKKEKETLNDKSKKSIRVALFVIAAIVVFYLGANFLKGIDTFSKKTYYYAVSDKTAGLNVGSIVVINGYPVGKITGISMISDNPFKICMEFFIKENIKIPTDSRVEITENLLSSTVLSLFLGNAHTYAKTKDTLQYLSTSTSMFDDISSILLKLNTTLVSLDTIAFSLKDVLVHEKGSQNIALSLSHLENIMAEADLLVGANRVKIDRMISNLAEFSKTLNENSPRLQVIIENFDKISDSLAKADLAAVVKNVNKAIEDINSIVYKINSGKGDVGQLLNNDTLYRNLEMTTHNLNVLMKDIKENPGRYVTIRVFGGKTKEERKTVKEKKTTTKEN
jgi:phospholipid/cholesterol/gamma-HCH transport system substrate-binding protein